MKTDPQLRLAALRDQVLPDALPAASVYDYTVDWSDAGEGCGFDPAGHQQHREYLRGVVDDVVGAVARRVLDDFAALPGELPDAIR